MQELSGSSADGQRTTLRTTLSSVFAEIRHLDLAERLSYDKKRIIGWGGYGDIFACVCDIAGRGKVEVAVKQIRIHALKDKDVDKLIKKEIRVWSRLKHSNILPLLGYIIDEHGFPCFVSEFMHNGTVLNYARLHPDLDIIHMIIGIAEGVHYLHNNRIIHSDLKSDNILVSKAEKPLICDFGISRMITISQTMSYAISQGQTTSMKGSARWMSPELLDPPGGTYTEHTKESDVWAFGMTVYELLSQKRPYHQCFNDAQVTIAIGKAKLPDKPDNLESWPVIFRDVWTLCEECWSQSPVDRPTMENIIARLKVIGLTLTSQLFGESSLPITPSEYFSRKENNVSTTDIIFDNITKLAEISNLFLESLQTTLNTATNDIDADRPVRTVLLDFVVSMKPLYESYILGHDIRLRHLNTLPEVPAVSEFLQQAQDDICSSTNAWDLQSLLSKPLHRHLKYCTLLKAIIETTPRDHPDKTDLIRARSLLEELARNVTEERHRGHAIEQTDNRKGKPFQVPPTGMSQLGNSPSRGRSNRPSTPPYMEVLHAQMDRSKIQSHFYTEGENKEGKNFYVNVKVAHEETETDIEDGWAPAWNQTFTLSPLNDSDNSVFTVELKQRLGSRRVICIGSATISLKVLSNRGIESEVGLDLLRPGVVGPSTPTATVFLRLKLSQDQLATQVDEEKDLAKAFANILSKLDVFVTLVDELSSIHPYLSAAWQVASSLYKAVRNQQAADQKLVDLVHAMEDIFDIISDAESIQDKIKTLESPIIEFLQQSTECCLFIRLYIRHGFVRRVLAVGSDQKIDDFMVRFHDLKGNLSMGIALQTTFVSVKTSETVDMIYLRNELRPVKMDASGRPQCLPGTRIEILDNIMDWIFSDTEENILWLRGVAGSGKSTISMTITEYCVQIRRRGAHLFFERGKSDPHSVIRTIAYWLASFDKSIADHIARAIRDHNGIVEASTKTRFERLLLEPLKAVADVIEGPVVVILDALDECGTPETRNELLSLLGNEFPKLPGVFRFLVTSRPEVDIADALQSSSVRVIELDRAQANL